MAFRLLAVFDLDTARAPFGIESLAPHKPRDVLDEEENQHVEELCHRTLSDCYNRCKPNSRKIVDLKRNGFALEACSFCQYVVQDGVHSVFAGEVSQWPGFDAVAAAHNAFMRGDPEPAGQDEAHWLLDFYSSFKEFSCEDMTDAVLGALAQIKGSFAFIIYDEQLHRVLAARDTEGSQPLFWGATTDSTFMLGSELTDLEECNPSATPFPAGTLYISQGQSTAVNPSEGWVMRGEQHHGRLFSFVESHKPGKKWRELKAIPRMTQEGCLCGAVYKVASERNVVDLGNPDVRGY